MQPRNKRKKDKKCEEAPTMILAASNHEEGRKTRKTRAKRMMKTRTKRIMTTKMMKREAQLVVASGKR